jgi:hypothetical protein
MNNLTLKTMKTKNVLSSLLLAAGVMVFTQCSPKKEHEHDHEATAPAQEHASGSKASAEATPPQFKVDAGFQAQLGGVFTSYVALKEAFVSSDAAAVKAKALATQQSLTAVDMKLLEGAAHHDWMNYLKEMEVALTAMQASADIEEQRKSFSTLSDNLYKSVKAYGLGGTTAFYEYCPMAFNDQGAYWLSDSETIRNPYFGDKMLSCGTVEEKLQ